MSARYSVYGVTMTAAMFQGEAGVPQVVGQAIKGALPHPAIQGLAQGSVGGPVMSDLQTMLANEKAQHQQAYGYANGHNDHGMGQ